MEEWFHEYMRKIRRDIEQIFEAIERELHQPLIDFEHHCLKPLYEVRETSDEILVRVDLPYVRSKDDISVSIAEDTLIIEAKMKRSIEFSDIVTYSNQKFDRFRLEIPLSAPIDPEGIRARFKFGLLEIVIPKKTRSFKVKVE